MEKAGFNGSGSEALKASLPLFCVGVLGMLIAVVLIDRLGRRTILLSTIIPMTICLAGMAIGFYVLGYHPDQNRLGGYLCLFFIMAYVGTFALGMGPVPWTVNAEIYPVRTT
jgi:MFS family permease